MTTIEIQNRLNIHKFKINFEQFLEYFGDILSKKYNIIENGIVKIIYDFLPGKPQNEETIKQKSFTNKNCRPFKVFGCNVLTKETLNEGFKWLGEQLNLESELLKFEA